MTDQACYAEKRVILADAVEVSANAPLVCLLPWRENPSRLVSMLDLMRVFEPRDILTRIRELRNTASLLANAGLPAPARLRLIEQLAEQIDLCHSAFTGLELRVSALRLAQIRSGIHTLKGMSSQGVADAAGTIELEIPLLVENELATHSFLAVAPSRKEYFDEPRRGWEEIISKFPDSLEDVEEMRKCFALSRYSAAVFHSLLVVEHGIIELGKQIGVTDPKIGWDATYNRLGSLLKDRATVTSLGLDFGLLEQVKSRLDSMKLAWRNKVNHAAGRLQIEKSGFNDESAEEVIMACRSFMRLLAERF